MGSNLVFMVVSFILYYANSMVIAFTHDTRSKVTRRNKTKKYRRKAYGEKAHCMARQQTANIFIAHMYLKWSIHWHTAIDFILTFDVCIKLMLCSLYVFLLFLFFTFFFIHLGCYFVFVDQMIRYILCVCVYILDMSWNLRIASANIRSLCIH